MGKDAEQMIGKTSLPKVLHASTYCRLGNSSEMILAVVLNAGDRTQERRAKKKMGPEELHRD